MASIKIDLTELHERFDRLESAILSKGTSIRKRLDAKDVAKLYQCSPSIVKKWARAGEIPGHQTPGGKWFFFSDELDSADKNRFK